MEYFQSVDVQIHITGTRMGLPVEGALERRTEDVARWANFVFGGCNIEQRRGMWVNGNGELIDETVNVLHASVAKSDFDTSNIEKVVLQRARLWKENWMQECVFVEFVLDRQTAFV